MQKSKVFVILGYIFLLWGIFDLLVKIHIYGLNELDFLWFCSITLFILAFGLILKNEMLLNSFISMALLVQPFWILDYIWVAFFNSTLNGLSNYAFEPGFRLIEFISNTRHVLMIPFGFFGVFTISDKDRKSYLFIPIFIIALLGFSFLLIPKYSNINCVNKPCVELLGILGSGLTYLIFFILITIILSMFINLIINTIFDKVRKFRGKKKYKYTIIFIFIILLFISFASIIMASLKYSKIPKYVCANPENCSNCSIRLRCKYFYSDGSDQILIYQINNNGNEDYICDIYLNVYPSDKNYKRIAEKSFIQHNKLYYVGEKLAYPKIDSKIQLKTDCGILKEG